jgi:outer membrane receptor protein involved in Fe transport
MERLIGAVNTLEMVFGLPVATSTFVNTGGANCYGVEAEVKTKIGKSSTLSAWYSYHILDLEYRTQIIRSFSPARHQAGLTYRYFLDKNWTFNANYSYTGISEAYDHSDVGDIQYSPYNETVTMNRLDLTISRKICRCGGEFMVGVADIFNKTEPAAYDFTNFTGFETPGRMFFARLQLKF